MSAPARYDDLGTVNAVKLLPKIDSYNGYIQLYTELDSHIEEGDTVFISYSGDTNQLDIFLDNYSYVIYSDNFIYDQYAQGYKVLWVNKMLNSFVINRTIYSIPKNSKIYGYYVSIVVCNNITIDNTNIDGTLFRNATINSNNILKQCVILEGDIIGCDIIDKYDSNYVSLLLDYDSDSDTYKKYSNLNNNGYGYSYFYNLNSSIYNCNIYNGNYYNCSINNTLDKTINDGCFYGCSIYNYHIYDGYFYNTQELSNDCVWHYGKWYGNTFELNSWEDGIFLDGIFGNSLNSIWQNGIFLDGIWKGLIWVNGEFSGGLFEGTGYTDATLQLINTQWYDGKFKGGKMLNSTFNTIYWKTGDVYGGELNNVIFNKVNIYDGEFYNVTIKNSNIYGGNFEVIRDNLAVYNRITNTNVYGGDFNGEWYLPIYDLSNNFSSSTYGLNEFSDSVISNGNFKYSAFYNFNEIKNGDFNESMFFSPIIVGGGKFYGNVNNNIINSSLSVVETYRSNQFNSEKFSMSKGSIRNKILRDTVTSTNVNKILIEFDNGHNFNIYDAGLEVQLVGFNSQELYEQNVNLIENDRYLDLSTYNGGYDWAFAVGNKYIIIDETYYNWMYGDTGLVRKMDWLTTTTSASTLQYTINNGLFNNTYFYGNIHIYNGVYNNVNMRNGIQFYNGIFNGNYFQSQSGLTDNNWYNGNFYSGVFGNNIFGEKETILLAIFKDECHIDNTLSNLLVSSNTYQISAIYPLVYHFNDNTVINQQNGSIAAFSIFSNTISNIYVAVRNDERSKKYMDNPVWNKESLYLIDDIFDGSTYYKFSPYEFVFKIDCNSEESKNTFIKYLEFIPTKSEYYIDIINTFLDPLTNTGKPYITFKDAYDMDYSYMGYVQGSVIGGVYPIYLVFKFNTIEKLFKSCTLDEKVAFENNFRNVWSIANCGYYTHPMPVLNSTFSLVSGSEDVNKVAKMSIKYTGTTSEGFISSTSAYNKWIYGTCPPPWWFNVNTVTSPYINWNIMFSENGISSSDHDIVWVGTIDGNNNPIVNNDSLCESYIINKSDIAQKFYSSLRSCAYDVNDLSTTSFQNPYSRKFTDWLYHYIYKHKNKTGRNYYNDVSFRKIYDYQVLTDPKFNIVKDYKYENNCVLSNLIYNSQKFECNIIGKAIYFDTKFDLNSYFTTGDTIYLENNTFSLENNLPDLGSGVGLNAYSSSVIPPPISDPNFTDGTYTITAISGYNYNSFLSNIVYVNELTNSTNSSANVYIQNQGLIVPYYYSVGDNNNGFFNYDSFRRMKPTNSIPSLYTYYNQKFTKSFISSDYKLYNNRLGIIMQPLFHNYYPETGFVDNNGYKQYYQHRNLYTCSLERSGSTSSYLLKFPTGSTGDVRPWGIMSGFLFDKITGLTITSTTEYCDINNILENWRYSENNINWISMSCMDNITINDIIEGSWQVSNSSITSGQLEVVITDPTWDSTDVISLIPTTKTVQVGIEPTISCAGKIVRILYKNEFNEIRTINTTILDYDFINRSYILDCSINNIFMDATDIYIGTNTNSVNIFDIELIPVTNDIIDPPSFNNGTKYNTKYWVTNLPTSYNLTTSKVTFPYAFDRLSLNPKRDYMINTVVNYIENYIGDSPIIAQRILNSSNMIKSIQNSNVVIPTTNKTIYADIIKDPNNNIIYQTSSYDNTIDWIRDNIRNYEIFKPFIDNNNNTSQREKIELIRTDWGSGEITITDKLQIEIESEPFDGIDYARNIIKEVNLKEKISEFQFKSGYNGLNPDLYIDKNSGMNYYGINQVYGYPHPDFDSQDIIWNLMKNVLNNDLTYYCFSGLTNYTDNINLQDSVMFSTYHKWKKDFISNYSSFNISDVWLIKLFYDMYSESLIFASDYVTKLTAMDILNFYKWNQTIQTSTQNFNKKAGIQILSKNVTASASGFKDQWFNGQFYGSDFQGVWHGGKWIGGNWYGWNTLNPGILSSGDTALMKPSSFNISSVPKQNYEINYEILKKRKKYYDNPPW